MNQIPPPPPGMHSIPGPGMPPPMHGGMPLLPHDPIHGQMPLPMPTQQPQYGGQKQQSWGKAPGKDTNTKATPSGPFSPSMRYYLIERKMKALLKPGQSVSWEFPTVSPVGIPDSDVEKLYAKYRAKCDKTGNNISHDLKALTQHYRRKAIDELLRKEQEKDSHPQAEWTIAALWLDKKYISFRQQETTAMRVILNRRHNPALSAKPKAFNAMSPANNATKDGANKENKPAVFKVNKPKENWQDYQDYASNEHVINVPRNPPRGGHEMPQMLPQGMQHQGMPQMLPQGMQHQGMPQLPPPPPGMQHQGMPQLPPPPPPGMQHQGMPQMLPQGMQHQRAPIHGMPPQAITSYGMPPPPLPMHGVPPPMPVHEMRGQAPMTRPVTPSFTNPFMPIVGGHEDLPSARRAGPDAARIENEQFTGRLQRHRRHKSQDDSDSESSSDDETFSMDGDDGSRSRPRRRKSKFRHFEGAPFVPKPDDSLKKSKRSREKSVERAARKLVREAGTPLLGRKQIKEARSKVHDWQHQYADTTSTESAYGSGTSIFSRGESAFTEPSSIESIPRTPLLHRRGSQRERALMPLRHSSYKKEHRPRDPIAPSPSRRSQTYYIPRDESRYDSIDDYPPNHDYRGRGRPRSGGLRSRGPSPIPAFRRRHVDDLQLDRMSLHDRSPRMEHRSMDVDHGYDRSQRDREQLEYMVNQTRRKRSIERLRNQIAYEEEQRREGRYGGGRYNPYGSRA